MAKRAIELLLRERKKAALHESIAVHAAKHAGAAVDLDEEIEAASVEHLLST